ncbi:MAG: ATPase [Oscillospiraceae bacterium]|nr:ATPase [Oscillospiraceae bacterium]
MEILKTIDVLEDKIERTKTIPLLNRILIDKEELFKAIDDIRMRLPEDLKQARMVKDERKQIINNAEAEAEKIIAEAKEKAAALVQEHEITKAAVEQAGQIIDEASRKARDLRAGANNYVTTLLTQTEEKISRSQEIVRSALAEMHSQSTMQISDDSSAN